MATPEGLSPEAQQRYDRLHGVMTQVHAELDSAANAIEECELAVSLRTAGPVDILNGAACHFAFRAVASHLQRAKRTLRLLYFCPGSSDEAKVFGPYKDAHLEHVRHRMAEVERTADVAVGSAKDAWADIKAKEARAHPVPCLSIACPDW